eukprot:1139617-Pelagomonas_calceolata.AAC.6
MSLYFAVLHGPWQCGRLPPNLWARARCTSSWVMELAWMANWHGIVKAYMLEISVPKQFQQIK